MLSLILSYHEGTREEISNRRVSDFMERLPEWEHAESIRVQLALLVRLYPRPLNHGNPDLIGGSMRFVSGEYEEPGLFDYFPQNVFTVTDQSQNVELGSASDL